MSVLEKQASALLALVANASGKTVDTLYASLIHKLGLTSPFFKDGWGDLKVVDFSEDAELLQQWPPPHFDVKMAWSKLQEGSKFGAAYELREGHFRTPCQGRIYDALPEESRTTYFQLLAPRGFDERTACVVHLAGTGDHGFERRIRLGAPLLQQGIATLVLESPYYGKRQPSWQPGSRLLRVSDLLVLGRATIEESLCLLEWAKGLGFGKLGMSGFSMGGVHASMVAGLFPGPVACAPLLAPRDASTAFCKGALWEATAWRPLARTEDEKHRDIAAVVREAAQSSSLAGPAVEVLRDLADRSRQLATASSRAQAGSGDSDVREAQGVNASPSAAAAGTRQTPSGAQHAQASEQADAGPGDLRAQAAQEAGSTSYGSAAAFLGFRLPSWRGSKRRHSTDGIGVTERRLRSLWGSRAPVAQQEARARLEAVLETYTDVRRFPRPKQPSAAVLVGALEDAYVARQSILELAAHWPGSEVRWVPGGHVSAFLLQQPAFRAAIVDSLARLRPDDTAAAAPGANGQNCAEYAATAGGRA